MRNSNGRVIPPYIYRGKQMTIKQAKDMGITILPSMPKNGYRIKGATTAPKGYYWISNGKSIFSGKRRTALVKEN